MFSGSLVKTLTSSLRTEQALGADSPVGGFFDNLRGRAADAQRWIAFLIMGMFDWYKPAGEIKCPVCGVVLKEWQGKDGPNGLFVWSEGEVAPVDQPIDEDAKISEEARRAFRLPEEFEIYSYDCQRHCVLAKCRSRDGIWSETSIVTATGV